ncbi:MAG: AAA family ATPase [bacterium]
MKTRPPANSSETQSTFDAIVGHDLLKRFVVRAADAGRLLHSFLLHGPPKVGKTSFAYALAKYVNCRKRPRSMGECDCAMCGKIARGTLIDLGVLGPRGAGGQLQVDDLREQMERAVCAPLEAEKRILLIAPADRMNPSSANALLKLLEEPPSRLLLVLVTDKPYALLPTVRSRCAQLRFGSVEEKALRPLLLARGASEEETTSAILLSGGAPGRALELIQSAKSGRREAMAEEMAFFRREGFAGLFRVAHRLAALGRESAAESGGATKGLEEILAILALWQRDLLIRAVDGPDSALIVNRDLPTQLSEAGADSSVAELHEGLENILWGFGYTGRVINEPLVMENLLLRLGKKH